LNITVALHHLTRYVYDRPVVLGPQTIRLRPAAHTRTQVKAYSLKVTPAGHFINWHQDTFGNFVARVLFPEPVQEFGIEVDLLAEIRAFNPFDFFLDSYAEKFPFEYEAGVREELAPYLEIKESGPALQKLIKSIDRSPQRTIDFLVGINQQLNALLTYTVRLEPGIQACEESLTLGSGSCRDMTWLLCQALRHMGLATRFASGYLIQLAPDEKSLDGPSGTATDFTDLHAWTEVFLPGAGWVGLDPTSGMFAGEGHIPLCCTANPSSAAPVTGLLEGNASSTLQHEMSVTRITEAPRVSKPYSETQWQAIDSLGAKVDAALREGDVRLTMGGEPTFVSLDDREHAAWHHAALGGTKKALAKDLFGRLQARFAAGGVPMFTQGKWYPGEILPRWAMPYLWRRDGEPVWRNPELLADPDKLGDVDSAAARNFITVLAGKLGIPDSYVLPVREDTPYYLWKERKLPLHDEIMSADVFERAERERLQTLLEGHLNEPAGFVLPLHYSHRRDCWISNRWRFQGPHVVALPGDSPVGLRLPLASLPWPEECALEVVPERSTFAPTEPLPAHADLVHKVDASRVSDKPFRDDPNGLIHSALCTQVREGVLHVFLPPVAWVEHALQLIAAIELVAEELGTPVVLEGYLPPTDVRLNSFSVTPDPGVIEVNVHPAASWEELRSITFGVYAEARLARLSAEKFMIDGRRVGTGGGNHIVLGAIRPEDSPFLRRPDLLRSMVCFWQNHPALSYLFSGMYVGPTSQSPRIDEARHESLYELEIAFQQIAGKQEAEPWVIDRLFRNLLVDLTGNTHRAEFCIDKLYSPDSDRGRLGLLEMRGFEMSPHPQMNLVQTLLLRALVACFWSTPCSGTLIRWGTRLHDRFLLPYFIEQDLREVLGFLQTAGFGFADEWFEPFLAFRFPECGQVQIEDAVIAVRTALEPWHVLGEQSSGGSTSRSVDATVERVQVTASGLVAGRHLLTCNGRRVPLTPTREAAVQVAGVRYKAWSSPDSLNPRLPVNAPLTFDVIDIAQQRSLGGCVYHVSHPGGLSFESCPVNENEAEGRKLARFQTIGYTPGKLVMPPEESNPEYPSTLDLRRMS
jgi:uncharacterized protein (DUF2126 family)/transglutaminase-like putative cysteine protease